MIARLSFLRKILLVAFVVIVIVVGAVFILGSEDTEPPVAKEKTTTTTTKPTTTTTSTTTTTVAPPVTPRPVPTTRPRGSSITTSQEMGFDAPGRSERSNRKKPRRNNPAHSCAIPSVCKNFP